MNNKSSLQKQNSVKPILCLTALMAFSAVIVFSPFIFGGKAYIYSDIGRDTYDVYYPFFMSLLNKIQAHDFSFWNFEMGFGANVLSRQADIGSIFTYITLLFGKENFKYALAYVQILKIFLSGYFCWIYLSNFDFDSKAKVTASYIFAFNGFTVLWGQHYFFATACLDAVLVLCAIESCFKNKKGIIYLSLATAIVLINSYYFAYMVLLFAAVYTLIRCVSIYTKSEISKAIKNLAGILTSVLVGIAMSFFLFLPSVYQSLTTTSRISGNGSLLQRIIPMITAVYNPEEIKSLLLKFLSNNLQGKGGTYYGILNYYEAPMLFFSCLTFFVAILLLSEKILEIKSNTKKSVIGLLEVLIVVFLIFSPFPSTVFNGFVKPVFRFTFLLMPVFAVAYAYTLDRIFKGKLKFAFAQISVSGIAALLISYNLIDWQATDYTASYYTGIMCVCVIAGVTVLALALQIKSLPKFFKTTAALGIVLILFANVTLESYITTARRDFASDTFYEKLSCDVANSDVEDAVEYLKSTDSSFYRIDKMFSDIPEWNDAQLQNYYSISSYNSVENHNILDFIDEFVPEAVTGPAHHYYSLRGCYENENAVSLLGVKYILSYKDISDIPSYTPIAQFGELTVYQNSGTDSIARFFTNCITYEEYTSLKQAGKEINLLETLVLSTDAEISADAPINSNNSVTVNSLNGKSNKVTAYIDAETDGWVFLSIPYEDGWKAYIDGEEAEIVQADLGFSAVKTASGEHTLTMEYNTPLFKQGVAVSVAGVMMFIAECVFVIVSEKKKRS